MMQCTMTYLFELDIGPIRSKVPMAVAVKVLSFGMSRLTLGWLVIRASGDTTAVVFRVEDRGSCFLRMQAISCHWIRYQSRENISIYFKA